MDFKYPVGVDAAQFSMADGVCLASVGARAIGPDGVPHQFFRKPIARVGHWRKDADDLDFEITRPMLAHWESTFSQMKAAQIDVPIPASHDDANHSDGNRGYVRDLWVDGDSLIMNAEMIGDDAILAAHRNNCSIDVPRRFVDGSGKQWDFPIKNVALCPDPVLPGLGAFVPIAASQSYSGDDHMEWDSIKKALGLRGTIDDENAPGKIIAAFKKLQGAGAKLSELAEALSLSLDGDDAVAEVAKVFEELKAKAANPAPKPDEKKDDVLPVPDWAISLSQKNGGLQLDKLVADGKIDANTSKLLTEQWLADDAVKLSLGRDGSLAMFDSLVEILAKNSPVGMNQERTGPQSNLSLSRDPLDGDDDSANVLVRDAERRAKNA